LLIHCRRRSLLLFEDTDVDESVAVVVGAVEDEVHELAFIIIRSDEVEVTGERVLDRTEEVLFDTELSGVTFVMLLFVFGDVLTVP
jgi:hypothetical protein